MNGKIRRQIIAKNFSSSSNPEDLLRVAIAINFAGAT
jgi:hypothetical protein